MNSSTLNESAREKLLFTSKWAKFSAYFSILNIFLGAFQLIIQGAKGDTSVYGAIFSFLISTILSIVIAINLLKFSRLSKYSTEYTDEIMLPNAFYHLKIYFSIIGVLMIILTSLVLLGISIGILAAIIS